MMISSLHRIKQFIGTAFFLIAITIIHYQLKQYHYTDITAVIQATPLYLIFFGLILTLFNYLILTSHDFLALQYIGKSLPKLHVMITAFLGSITSNTIGHALISWTPTRYRFYSAWGLSSTDMIRLTLFLRITYFLGVMTLTVATFFLLPQIQQDKIHPIIYIINYIILAVLLLYLIATLSLHKPFTIHNIHITLPSVRITAAQTGIASLNLILASLAFYIFLHHHTSIPFSAFLIVFLVAQIIGLCSQVPGGLGVFEGVFLITIGNSSPPDVILASLILYRIIYYFVPFLTAVCSMLCYTIVERRKTIANKARKVHRITAYNTPRIFSLLLFLSGGVLLFSSVTPTDKFALNWLKDVMPLSVVEFSHVLGTTVGVTLLLLARAVRMRINTAYFVSLGMIVLGIIASLLKGFDWQEAIILCVLLLLMLPTRRFFYRESTLLRTPFNRYWLAFIAMILIAAIGLGFFSYKHIEYRDSLWWQFEYYSDASRFLRSLVVIILTLSALAFLRLIRNPRLQLQLLSPEKLDQLQVLAQDSKATRAHLALLGDKSILWSEDNRSFIMYATGSKYWIVLGNPIGTPEEQENLAWRLMKMADRKGAKLAFYQVSKDNLPLYLDMGLILVKLGEEARVPLQGFSLEGSKRKGIRQAHNKITKPGNISFEVLEREQVIAQMAELKAISDCWLANKKGTEKAFSLGFFDENYVKRTRVGVVRQDGKIVAFANLWETNSKHELSCDLTRFLDTAPQCVMEWLFIQLMLWGASQGYHFFNLGMAPLSGLETHTYAPLWYKIGHIIFEYGGEFYNFEGLRAYKNKFDPIWEPCYLAVPNSLNILSVLIAVTRLIAGGKLTRAFRK